MSRTVRNLAILALVVALAGAAAGCAKLQARDNLNKGVQAFKSGNYDGAIQLFQKARELDPTLVTARLYLATSYRAQYIPGAPSKENLEFAEKAIELYKEILKDEPNNLHAIDSLGWIYFQMGGTPYDPKKFETSRDYYMQHIKVKGDDPEAYYWVGVIEWTLAYRANREARANWNNTAPPARKIKRDEDPLPEKVREEFAAKYAANIDNGIQQLKRALELDPEYENAIAYLNLLYRQKADIVASAQERESYFAEADKLVDLHKVIRQKKTQQPAPTS